MNKAHLEIPIHNNFVKPAVDFVLSYATQLGLADERKRSLRGVVAETMGIVLESNSSDVDGLSGTVAVDVLQNDRGLSVRIVNKGNPFFEDDARLRLARYREKADASGLPRLDRVEIVNLGRGGQELTLEVRMGLAGAGEVLRAGTLKRERLDVADTELDVRLLRPEEAPALSRLFHSVYGYDYIGDFVYFPERLQAMLTEGRLVSTVAALPGGRLIGHVGLVRRSESPASYEPCLGVVDPTVKSKGTFKRLFEETMKRASALPMSYSFTDCVTNIDFSQRLVERHGYCDTALFLGSQSKETQAKLSKLGLGRDPDDMDRYSIIYSVSPRSERPFGEEVVLPGNLGDMMGFLLKPLNLDWIPAPRFNPLGREGEYSAREEQAQKSVYFELHQPGLKAVHRLLDDWHRHLRTGFQYAAVDVPVDRPGLGQVHDLLAEQGFFVAGFLPWRNSGRLAFRFQAVGPTRVAFDKIKVHSETGRRLLETIRLDYERNVRL